MSARFTWRPVEYGTTGQATVWENQFGGRVNVNQPSLIYSSGPSGSYSEQLEAGERESFALISATSRTDLADLGRSPSQETAAEVTAALAASGLSTPANPKRPKLAVIAIVIGLGYFAWRYLFGGGKP